MIERLIKTDKILIPRRWKQGESKQNRYIFVHPNFDLDFGFEQSGGLEDMDEQSAEQQPDFSDVPEQQPQIPPQIPSQTQTQTENIQSAATDITSLPQTSPRRSPRTKRNQQRKLKFIFLIQKHHM